MNGLSRSFFEALLVSSPLGVYHQNFVSLISFQALGGAGQPGLAIRRAIYPALAGRPPASVVRALVLDLL